MPFARGILMCNVYGLGTMKNYCNDKKFKLTKKLQFSQSFLVIDVTIKHS